MAALKAKVLRRLEPELFELTSEWRMRDELLAFISDWDRKKCERYVLDTRLKRGPRQGSLYGATKPDS